MKRGTRVPYNCTCIISDEKPTLPNLLNFPTTTGETLNIITKIGMNYEMLGTLLLNDDSGAILPAIKTQMLLDPSAITMEIMRRWVNGQGRDPTWQTLVDCLNSVGLSHIASSIKQSL